MAVVRSVKARRKRVGMCIARCMLWILSRDPKSLPLEFEEPDGWVYRIKSRCLCKEENDDQHPKARRCT